MRMTYTIPVLVILGFLSTAACGFDLSGAHARMAGCKGCGYGSYETLSAPACAAPGYGLVPGCCESAPSCCDNVWDGYCQESHCFSFPLFRGCRLAPRCGLGGGGCCPAQPTCGEAGCQPSQGTVDVIEEGATAPAIEAPQPPEEAPQA